MNELALFAGAGGGVLGSRLLGHRIVCYVERDPYCVKVLKQRIADGFINDAPIWDDVRTFDGKPWRGVVDCVSGGFPCQDISYAGNGAGLAGERSGLWSEMARIIGEVRPRFAFVENSAALIIRGIGTVLGDLAAMGFDAQWGVLGANHVGGRHQRARAWVVADSKPNGWLENTIARESSSLVGVLSETCEAECPQAIQPGNRDSFRLRGIEVQRTNRNAWDAIPEPGRVSKPGVDGMADGLANRMDRLKAIGNGQVPAVVRAAWELLSESA